MKLITACLALSQAGCMAAPAAIAGVTAATPIPTQTAPPAAIARERATATPSPTGTGLPVIPSATLTPSATVLPTPLACWSLPGKQEAATLSDPRLRLPMEYNVYLPPCYAELSETRYPVLYLIHGQNYNHDQWHRLGADETADRLIAAGETSPFIIIMPHDRLWEQPENDPFGDVLEEKLVPRIDQTYRTLPDRQYRAVGGLSRGAGWAVHLGLSRWDLFGAIGGHSLPVFWSDTRHVRAWLAAIPADAMPRIYLDIGEKDRPAILESARWFEGLLTEKNISHEWFLFPGYHEEAYWRAHVEQYLRWYAAGW